MIVERIGIMQGRLLVSATGALDAPPGDRWREELPLAGLLGLHHLELVAEREPTTDNPIWTTEGRAELAALATGANVRLASLCVNEPLGAPFSGAGVAADLAARLVPVVDALRIRTVVLPLLEASDVAALSLPAAAAGVRVLADALARAGARVALELSLSAAASAGLLDAIDHPRVSLCYDLGNATAAGHDVVDEIATLGPRIRHVHAKDKDAQGTNVRFGTGLVPFGAALAALAAVGYPGLVTMEATRGEDPVRTAAEHIAFLTQEHERLLHPPVPHR